MSTAKTEGTITVTQVKSSIGTKPKHRGTLRALGLGKIGNTNTLPDRPEIRGMIARVPHLISVAEEELTMQVHDLAPAPGSTKNAKRVGRGTGGKGGKTAGRGTKGQRARNTVARGFEGGQMPLKQRVPKLKGFNNPFRVEYQAVNLHTLGDLVEKLGDADVDRRRARRQRHRPQGSPSSRCSPAARSRPRSTCTSTRSSKSAEQAITDAGGTVTLVELPFKAEGQRRTPGSEGQPVRQPLTPPA